MNTQNQSPKQDASTQANPMQEKLDQAWQNIERTSALEFLKNSVTPETSLAELAQILSYDKVMKVKDQLSGVAIGEIVAMPQVTVRERPVSYAPMARKATPRGRTRRVDIEREEVELLATIRENPGANRGTLAKKVRTKLGGNKSLAHVSYLLRRLNEHGRVKKSGDRRDATYQAA